MLCAVTLTPPSVVQVAPGKVGLVHISELALTRVTRVSDVVSVGAMLDVKLLEVNARGQLRLSHRAVLEEDAL
jgi:polyribonucleotide nucleotidyltransferase